MILVLEGELCVGDRRCGAGTALVLEKGTPFGRVVAGEAGAVLFETFDGEPGHVSEDYTEFLRIIEQRGITVLREPDPSVPAQGAR